MAQPIYLDPELQGIERQRQIAQTLQQRGMQTPQGQMVSGRYVAPSFTQYLANAFDVYGGKKGVEEAESKAQAYANALRNQSMQDIQAYGQAVKGTPEQTVYGAGMEGPTMNVTPAVAPDYTKGLSVLMGSKSPQSQALAQALLADQLKTQVLPEGGTIVRGGIGGAGETISSGPKKTTDQKEYELAQSQGYKGSFFDFQTDLRKAGATNVTVPVNTEKSYGSAFGQGLAKNDLDLYDTAQRAPEVLNNVLSTKKLLDSGNVYTGFGANAKLDLARVGTALGVVGKETADKVANTQQLFSNRAQATLDSIKSSGLGSGQGFSNKDREFLEAAKLGNITYDRETLNRQLLIEEKVARAAANKWNTRYKSIPKSAIDPTGINPVSIPSEGAIDTSGGSGRGWRMK
jgi:hypothetical protein